MLTPLTGKDHVNMNIPICFKALPDPQFSPSGHISLILLPTHSLMIKRVNQSVKAVEVWPWEATVTIHDYFEYTDWHVFRLATTWENHIIRHITCVPQRQSYLPTKKPWWMERWGLYPEPESCILVMWQGSIQHCLSKTESHCPWGKEEPSAETKTGVPSSCLRTCW